MASQRIAIIGAGPTGLEAALYALERQHSVTIFERGRVAESMREWGSTRLFSPFRLNCSARGVARLEASGAALPEPGSFLTGAEHVARYLEPLAQTFPSGTIRQQTSVLRIGRDRLLKGDGVGGGREGHPFRLLVTHDGKERIETADTVIDCSGTWCRPNALGNGGIRAPGERAAADAIRYRLGDILRGDRARYEGKRVLLVGAGYSAATALDQLAQLPRTSTVWARSNPLPNPFPRIQDDPLPERDRLAAQGNQISRDGADGIRCLAGAVVECIERSDHGLRVTLETASGSRQVEVDSILALVGYRPDREIYAELQVHECWATMGSMRLAATLLDAGDGDCLAQPSMGAETLLCPEPNFFILGAKSYGKNSDFLIRVGLQQVHDLFSLIASSPQPTVAETRDQL